MFSYKTSCINVKTFHFEEIIFYFFPQIFPKNSDDVIKNWNILNFFFKNLKHLESLIFWPSLKTIGPLEQQLV